MEPFEPYIKDQDNVWRHYTQVRWEDFEEVFSIRDLEELELGPEDDDA